MSNYPPGVTGREYEISGPTYEETEERDCPNQQCMYVPVDLVRAHVATAVQRLVEVSLFAKPLTSEHTMKEVRKALADLNELVIALPGEEAEFPCEFSGDVDVTGYGDQKWWTCPRCGAEHTEDVEDDGPTEERDSDR